MTISSWSERTEEELGLLIKDWLKQNGHTQSDLKKSLGAISTRMSALIEVLKKEHLTGGFPSVASRLCEIEKEWESNSSTLSKEGSNTDPLGQLDLLLEEILEDCDK